MNRGSCAVVASTPTHTVLPVPLFNSTYHPVAGNLGRGRVGEDDRTSEGGGEEQEGNGIGDNTIAGRRKEWERRDSGLWNCKTGNLTSGQKRNEKDKEYRARYSVWKQHRSY
eukprot:749770-Hanusia_phi.AAC.3